MILSFELDFFFFPLRSAKCLYYLNGKIIGHERILHFFSYILVSRDHTVIIVIKMISSCILVFSVPDFSVTTAFHLTWRPLPITVEKCPSHVFPTVYLSLFFFIELSPPWDIVYSFIFVFSLTISSMKSSDLYVLIIPPMS